MARASKGSAFERWFCVELSKWWTKGKREDIFWRTAGSGARATVRGRKGKTTGQHCGDICAIDPKGNRFLKVITLELKRGYPKATLHNLLDKPAKAKDQDIESWIKQAKLSAKNAGTPYWMIVHKRDQRDPIIIVPKELYLGANMLPAKTKWLAMKTPATGYIFAVTLATFFNLDPQAIKDLC